MSGTGGRKLWGGRFEASTDALVERLNNSLPFDRRLWREDIRGSIAHATMLGKTGIILSSDADQIVSCLECLEREIDSGETRLPDDLEDIHTAVEYVLTERLGEVGRRLHTARSRNDQVATDLRMYSRHAIDMVVCELRDLQVVLADLASQHLDTVMPGYTHLQHAQPILLAHHLLAYFWMFQRDRERMDDTRGRTNVLPLGSGALAGTPFAIDREMCAELLDFGALAENSLDAVSDRDYVVEFLSAASLIMVHCSRLAEDLIFWSTQEVGFVSLADAVTTGSSMMPQKKNPDVAELARGKTGRVFGSLVAMLTVLKGLPMTYNKDLQEDKEALFDAVDTLAAVVPAMRLTLSTAAFRADRMRAALVGDFSTATDLADRLVTNGVAFRDAHGVVGRIVRHCEEHGIRLEDLSPEDLGALAPQLGVDPVVPTPEASVASRCSHGGTARDAVERQLTAARRLLGDAI